MNLADLVIILSPNLSKEEEHQALSDKESILITQNLKAMTFERVETPPSDELENPGANVEVPQSNPVAMPAHIAEVKAQGSTRGANIPMITELGMHQLSIIFGLSKHCKCISPLNFIDSVRQNLITF